MGLLVFDHLPVKRRLNPGPCTLLPASLDPKWDLGELRGVGRDEERGDETPWDRRSVVTSTSYGVTTRMLGESLILTAHEVRISSLEDQMQEGQSSGA